MIPSAVRQLVRSSSSRRLLQSSACPQKRSSLSSVSRSRKCRNSLAHYSTSVTGSGSEPSESSQSATQTIDVLLDEATPVGSPYKELLDQLVQNRDCLSAMKTQKWLEIKTMLEEVATEGCEDPALLRRIADALVPHGINVQYTHRPPSDKEKAESRGYPYPDLMATDPLMDSRDVLDFPPEKGQPYHNRVVVRNHASMFHEAMERSDFDFRSVTWKPNDTKGSVSASLNSEVPKRPFPFVYDLLSRIVKQQTGKGKIARIERICIVGNGKGMVGLGIGKDAEGHRALDRARGRAVKNMDFVERFEERTIYTEMQAKLGSTRIIMRPRPVGFGLRCNPYMHQIFRACGIKDISAKVWGSRNPINVMHATLRMLQSGHAPILMGDGLGGPGRKLSKGSGIMSQEAVERSRGRRLATLRKTT